MGSHHASLVILCLPLGALKDHLDLFIAFRSSLVPPLVSRRIVAGKMNWIEFAQERCAMVQAGGESGLTSRRLIWPAPLVTCQDVVNTGSPKAGIESGAPVRRHGP